MTDASLSPALTGTWTALVTPMLPDGRCDWPALEALCEGQVAAGVDGVVVCGSTGEAATLTAEERDEALRRVVAAVNKRCKVMVGTGAQSTHATLQAQRTAARGGADVALVVTPFYNRPTQEGLLRHYRAIAEQAELPVVLYNVPTRTGCDMRPELVAQLAQLDNVVGIKEAVGEMDRISSLRQIRGPFSLLSGDDPTACAACLMGADGLISVASNVDPEGVVALVRAARAGNVDEARALHGRLRPLFSVLGLESNPIPVKTALALRGQMHDTLRLPLCEMQGRNRGVLQQVLEAGNWLG